MNSHLSYDMHTEIVKDNEYLVEAWAYINDYSQASAFIVTECNIGQAVWVRGGSDADYMYGSSGLRSSHFSGALIYAFV